MTHVLGIGHAATHCGASKKPMHSVHFSGSMANSKLLSEMALFGHSLRHAEQPVQEDSLIMYAIVASLPQTSSPIAGRRDRRIGAILPPLRRRFVMDRLASDRPQVLKLSKATDLPKRK